MYWNTNTMMAEKNEERWIVTLDVLKWCMRIRVQEHMRSWIVTLDVLKSL